MDISILLLWAAGGAVATDITVYMLSGRLRRYGGHLIGTMGHIILLADLAHSLYQGQCSNGRFNLVMGRFWSSGRHLLSTAHIPPIEVYWQVIRLGLTWTSIAR